MNKELAQNLADALQRVSDRPVRLASRIGRPRKVITVTETVSEKVRRIVAECDKIRPRT